MIFIRCKDCGWEFEPQDLINEYEKYYCEKCYKEKEKRYIEPYAQGGFSDQGPIDWNKLFKHYT